MEMWHLRLCQGVIRPHVKHLLQTLSSTFPLWQADKNLHFRIVAENSHRLLFLCRPHFAHYFQTLYDDSIHFWRTLRVFSMSDMLYVLGSFWWVVPLHRSPCETRWDDGYFEFVGVSSILFTKSHKRQTIPRYFRGNEGRLCSSSLSVRCVLHNRTHGSFQNRRHVLRHCKESKSPFPSRILLLWIHNCRLGNDANCLRSNCVNCKCRERKSISESCQVI